MAHLGEPHNGIHFPAFGQAPGFELLSGELQTCGCSVAPFLAGKLDCALRDYPVAQILLQALTCLLSARLIAAIEYLHSFAPSPSSSSMTDHTLLTFWPDALSLN